MQKRQTKREIAHKSSNKQIAEHKTPYVTSTVKNHTELHNSYLQWSVERIHVTIMIVA